MAFTFARFGAVLGIKVEDYYANGKRWWVRLHEKGRKFHEVPAHHTLEEDLDAYIKAAGVAGDPKSPLFRSANRRSRKLTNRPLRRNNALDMAKRRAKAAGIPPRICCNTFRATGITAYLEEGGAIEKAQAIAFHESPKTTKLYDRTRGSQTPMVPRPKAPMLRPRILRRPPFSNFPLVEGFQSRHSGGPTSPG